MKARRTFWFKSIAVFAGLNLLVQTFYPTIAFALTGGPSQPEMQGFEPIGTSNMVDLSTGSFTYNIPLMDVDGYPINLSYHSGISMDQEASWLGLGWSINPGEINRQMRGLPDEFNGDRVIQNYNMKDNTTVGFSAGVGLKVMGAPIGLNLSLGIFANNYRGPGVETGINPSISAGVPNGGKLTGSLGVNFNSQSGVDIAPSIGFSQEASLVDKNSTTAGITVGSSYNSRSGLKGISMTKDIGTPKINSASETQSLCTFSNPTYIPTITMPLVNNSITADVTAGLAIFGGHPNVTITGWWNQQSLATHTLSLPAYGYMYADQAKDRPYALHDFNREKDVPFQQNIANLPITNFTYDLFTANGQGVSGQFRPFRGDVAVLYDHYNYNQSTSKSLGFELGLTEVSHTGINYNTTNSNTITDKWTQNNNFTSTVDFKSLDSGNINYEPFYFKQIGEKTINDVNYYNAIGDVNPAYVSLFRSGGTVLAQNIFNMQYGSQFIGSNPTKTRREKRSQTFSLLNAQEANYFGLDKYILSYPLNQNVYLSRCDSSHLIQHISRLNWPMHHTSEITVLNPDGKRYIYGIPAYNLLQDEVTFSVHGTSPYYSVDTVNIIKYDQSSDNSVKNIKGRDNYFNEQILPPYAHSYLLTGVLSPDYVDLTGNGITDDDLGQAVKINYTRIDSSGHTYNWRVPFEKDTASYQVGLLTDTGDDKGNYIYGQKEIWYVHSIESKTMVAQFILENREDGFGVVDKNGGADTTKHLMRVKEIQLFSKADLINNGSNAVPIKTVHFVYSYALCPGTPNSFARGGRGKLTLTGVYFTYGNNTEGSLNSYKFNYSNFNPSYNHNRYDRWGYYKYNSSGMPCNEDFPYTLQDPTKTNLFATAWELTNISLPSGGQIKVNYEANDYAYVQNQRATQMFLVDGVSSTPTGSVVTTLYSSSTSYNNWIRITLPYPEYSSASFYNDYLAGVDENGSKLYFRFLTDMNGNSNYEYVPGYADIGGYQMTTDPYHWAIQLKQVSTGDGGVSSANPIALSAWQFVRLNMPQYAYPGSNTNGGVLGVIEGLLGILPSVVQIFEGYDKYCAQHNFGKNIKQNYSYIRLNNPIYKKYGGGARVSEIDISDNWSNMVNHLQSNFIYGQTYTYTTTLGNLTVSSGVATYEPLAGGDENPCRQPLSYQEKYLCAPNNNFYTETPLGESLYPSAGIVYSKVTVTNLKYKGVSRTSTGYTVNDFYTAYDFPVLNKYTAIDPQRIKPSVLSTIFNFNSEDLTTVSQGFTVEVNNMAGKEKGQEVYDGNGALISSVSYLYNVDDPSASPSFHLNNQVSVANPDGSVSIASIGKDIDVWEDMREQTTQTDGSCIAANDEFFVIPFFFIPINIPPVYQISSSQKTQFRSAATVKYIYRTGLLNKVIKTQNGSTSTTQNLLYDSETGDVLLTQTNNEFDEPIYNFTYPAHWVYDGMGSAYKNIGATTGGITISAGVIPSMYNSFFTPGDEVESYNYGVVQDSLYWVTQVNPSAPLILMDSKGALANFHASSLKIIRSGRRNMASTPIGTVETMNLPESGGYVSIDSTKLILQASATQFSNAWQTPTNNIMQRKCNTYSLIPDTAQWDCIGYFLQSIIRRHQLFAHPNNMLHSSGYCYDCCTYDDMQYYALTPPQPDDYMTNFVANLGGCILTISSVTGRPIHFDSLALKDYVPPYAYIFPNLTGSGCLKLYHNTDVGMWDSTELELGLGSDDSLEAIACLSCDTCVDVCTNLALYAPMNPYTLGMLGDWRPQKNYVYSTDRTPYPYSYTSLSSVHHTDIWKNGTLRHFNPIWTTGTPSPFNGISWYSNPTLDSNWICTSQVTKYDEKGNEVEEVNPLGNYSSALYGYLGSVPVAVASNARFQDIGFDGFEDYYYSLNCGNRCANDHWDFNSAPIPVLTNQLAHTGIYSVNVPPKNFISVTRSINHYNDSLYRTTPGGQFELLPGGNIPLFSPDSGKYLISAWVNENTPCTTGYPQDSIVVKILQTGPNIYSFHASGPVIDGWQRFEGTFYVTGSATNITVNLVAGAHGAFYDDIRIQPYAAEMKTYVYDPTSMRLMATLDENNYATFYEYNDEGILTRVKKETEKGIMTIKENRSSYKR